MMPLNTATEKLKTDFNAQAFELGAAGIGRCRPAGHGGVHCHADQPPQQTQPLSRANERKKEWGAAG